MIDAILKVKDFEEQKKELLNSVTDINQISRSNRQSSVKKDAKQEIETIDDAEEGQELEETHLAAFDSKTEKSKKSEKRAKKTKEMAKKLLEQAQEISHLKVQLDFFKKESKNSEDNLLRQITQKDQIIEQKDAEVSRMASQVLFLEDLLEKKEKFIEQLERLLDYKNEELASRLSTSQARSVSEKHKLYNVQSLICELDSSSSISDFFDAGYNLTTICFKEFSKGRSVAGGGGRLSSRGRKSYAATMWDYGISVVENSREIYGARLANNSKKGLKNGQNMDKGG